MAINLRLEIRGEDTLEIVCQWERDGDSPWSHEIGQEADRSLEALAEETGQKLSGRLALYTADGKYWTSFHVKVEPEDGAQNFEGTSKALLQQQQKHFELSGLQYFKATEAAIRSRDEGSKILLDIVNTLKDLVVFREQRSQRLEEEIARLRDENATLRGENTEATAIAETAVESAEKAIVELEETRKKGGDDAAMMQIFTQAIAAPDPKPSAKKSKVKSSS